MYDHDDETRDERARRQEALREQFGPMYEELLALLFRYDPIRLNYVTNTDEYIDQVMVLLPRLSGCTSARHVERVVHEVFARRFDAESVGEYGRWKELGVAVWELWQTVRDT